MSDSDVGMGGENQGKGKKGWDVAGFIPWAIVAFLWNPLSGANPFRKKRKEEEKFSFRKKESNNVPRGW